MKLLLFDLDGTLLRRNKTISARTLQALARCRERGILIGIATSRSEANCQPFLPLLQPDVFISSSGTLVTCRGKTVASLEFSPEQAIGLIQTARAICGDETEITVDTQSGYYWNYKVDPNEADSSWGDTIWTDYRDFRKHALKICVDIPDETAASALAAEFPDYNCIRFSGTNWYQYTKSGATKEQGARILSEAAAIPMEEITAFGDDLTDIGMLQACGTGIAMGNAAEAVKSAADLVIGTNEEDGIARWLEDYLDAGTRKLHSHSG